MDETKKKYPNAYFRVKPCRRCGTEFQPDAPSHLYCSASCASDEKRDIYYRTNYGIDYAEYERMFLEQGGVCFICEEVGFIMNTAIHKHRLCVDHNHYNGAVRKLLCHNCNRAIGLLKDSRTRARKLLKYLEDHREGATTIPQGSRDQAVPEAHGTQNG